MTRTRVTVKFDHPVARGLAILVILGAIAAIGHVIAFVLNINAVWAGYLLLGVPVALVGIVILAVYGSWTTSPTSRREFVRDTRKTVGMFSAAGCALVVWTNGGHVMWQIVCGAAGWLLCEGAWRGVAVWWAHRSTSGQCPYCGHRDGWTPFDTCTSCGRSVIVDTAKNPNAVEAASRTLLETVRREVRRIDGTYIVLDEEVDELAAALFSRQEERKAFRMLMSTEAGREVAWRLASHAATSAASRLLDMFSTLGEIGDGYPDIYQLRIGLTRGKETIIPEPLLGARLAALMDEQDTPDE